MTLNTCIDMFLLYVAPYGACRTLEYYKVNIGNFRDFVYGVYQEDISVNLLDEQLFISYVCELRKKNLSNVSINTYTRAIRVFDSWLFNNNIIEKRFTSNIKKLRDDSSPVIPLTNKDCQIIDVYLQDNLRNYLIFHMFLDLGLRLQEVLALDIEDIKTTYLVVRNSKFNKSRFVPLPDSLLKYLLKYIGERQIGALFLSKEGIRITKSVVNKMFKNIKKCTGIEYIYPHQLRHTFATSFCFYGGNLEMLRIILGHADINITQKYIHIAQQCYITKLDIYKVDGSLFLPWNRN